MPQQTDPAIPTALSSISSELLSSKVRIVGSVWFYDANSTTLWLEDERRGIPVDISLCLDLRKSQSWLREPGNKVMAVGYLERPEEMDFSSVQRPPARPHTELLRFILRAILLKESNDLDLRLWRKAIEERGKVDTFP